MGEETKLLDDLVQENETLHEQLKHATEEISMLDDMIGRMQQQLVENVRTFIHIPNEHIEKARGDIAMEDGTEMIRSIYETGRLQDKDSSTQGTEPR